MRKEYFEKFDEDESIIVPDFEDYFDKNHSYNSYDEPDYMVDENSIFEFEKKLTEIADKATANREEREIFIKWLQKIIDLTIPFEISQNLELEYI